MASAKSIIVVVLALLMVTTMGYCEFHPQPQVRVPNVGDSAGAAVPKYNKLFSTSTYIGKGDHSPEQTLETSKGLENFPPQLMLGTAIFFMLFFFGDYFVAVAVPVLAILFVFGAAYVIYNWK